VLFIFAATEYYNGSLTVISVLYLRAIFHLTTKRGLRQNFFFFTLRPYLPVDKNFTLDTIGIGIWRLNSSGAPLPNDKYVLYRENQMLIIPCYLPWMIPESAEYVRPARINISRTGNRSGNWLRTKIPTNSNRRKRIRSCMDRCVHFCR